MQCPGPRRPSSPGASQGPGTPACRFGEFGDGRALARQSRRFASAANNGQQSDRSELGRIDLQGGIGSRRCTCFRSWDGGKCPRIKAHLGNRRRQQGSGNTAARPRPAVQVLAMAASRASDAGHAEKTDAVLRLGPPSASIRPSQPAARWRASVWAELGRNSWVSSPKNPGPERKLYGCIKFCGL